MSGAMSSMGNMPMPDQSWLGSATTFLGMWTVMMVAMMLPVLLPMLDRYRRAIATTNGVRLGLLTAVVASGYFGVWVALGAVVFPVGTAAAAVETQEPGVAAVVPLLAGAIVAVAGIFQFSAWKMQLLAHCAAAPAYGALRADALTALQHGIRLGARCAGCCAGLTAVLVVMGVMDLRLMAAVAAAILLERLLPSGLRVAHATGTMLVVAGLALIVRALG